MGRWRVQMGADGRGWAQMGAGVGRDAAVQDAGTGMYEMWGFMG